MFRYRECDTHLNAYNEQGGSATSMNFHSKDDKSRAEFPSQNVDSIACLNLQADAGRPAHKVPGAVANFLVSETDGGGGSDDRPRE